MAGGPVKILDKALPVLHVASSPSPPWNTIYTVSLSNGLVVRAEFDFTFLDVANSKMGVIKFLLIARCFSSTTVIVLGSKVAYVDGTPAALTTIDAALATSDVQAVVSSLNVDVQVKNPATTGLDWMGDYKAMFYKP